MTEPAAVSPVPPPADRAALRDRIAEALYAHDHPSHVVPLNETGMEPAYRESADAVLAVLPPPADRAAVERVRAVLETEAVVGRSALEYRGLITAALMAGEETLSPYYSHEACGFHWHGRDGMDIPMRDGQPVCPRCELSTVEKRLHHTERRREEVGAESLRRGKTVLDQSEKIRALERELDGVRRQLGAEILRADQAEGELRRMAAKEQPAETPSMRLARASIESMVATVTGERPAVGEQPETQEAPRPHTLDGAAETEEKLDLTPTREARPECAHCWREIENRGTPNMGGPTHDNWVHVPGGFTVCFPQRGGDSPRAEPRTPE